MEDEWPTDWLTLRSIARVWDPEPGVGQVWVVVFALEMINGRFECTDVCLRSHGEGLSEIWMGERQRQLLEQATQEGRFGPRPLRSSALRDVPFAALLAHARRELAQEVQETTAPKLAALFREMASEDHPQYPHSATGEYPYTKAQLLRMADVAEDYPEAMADSGPKGRGRPPKYSQADLENVASIYSDAYRNDADTPHPTLAVMKQLGCGRSTATKLVMKCRAAGLLGPVERGTAGGVLPFRAGPVPANDDEGGSDDDTT